MHEYLLKGLFYLCRASLLLSFQGFALVFAVLWQNCFLLSSSTARSEICGNRYTGSNLIGTAFSRFTLYPFMQLQEDRISRRYQFYLAFIGSQEPFMHSEF